MSISTSQRQLVTDHAIIRWLEHVEGYDFDDIRKELGPADEAAMDRLVLNYVADKYGLFRGHVVYRIVTKQVRNAIKMGAKRVHRGTQTLVISGGRIVTLMPRKR